jgi:hypothetical protein
MCAPALTTSARCGEAGSASGRSASGGRQAKRKAKNEAERRSYRPPRETRNAPFQGVSAKRMKGLEPSTFCMARKMREVTRGPGADNWLRCAALAGCDTTRAVCSRQPRLAKNPSRDSPPAMVGVYSDSASRFASCSGVRTVPSAVSGRPEPPSTRGWTPRFGRPAARRAAAQRARPHELSSTGSRGCCPRPARRRGRGWWCGHCSPAPR